MGDIIIGLSKGPDWKDDAFNYINSQVSELEMHHDEFNEFFEDNFLFIKTYNLKQNLKSLESHSDKQTELKEPKKKEIEV